MEALEQDAGKSRKTTLLINFGQSATIKKCVPSQFLRLIRVRNMGAVELGTCHEREISSMIIEIKEFYQNTVQEPQIQLPLTFMSRLMPSTELVRTSPYIII